MIDLNNILPEQMKVDRPEFNSGDHIKVHVRVIEGDKERIQPFEGDVISIRGNGMTKTFTVRKMSSGVGVERIFPFYSPKIARIELLKKGDVRRAKLFYLRNLSGKAARIKSKS
jgi:large subunit ribosomal protein L19